MPKHTTSVIEIREAGMLLRTSRTHVIRVLGALKEVPYTCGPAAKENCKTRADPSVYDDYYNGKLKGSQQDPSAKPFHPRVPALFITWEGDAVFLERDWM
jgi:hypothetical protein